MDYSLAKRLKEAGFPQGKGIIGSSHHVVFSDVHTDSDGNLITSGDALEVPTLEELIEACGNDFAMLSRPISKKSKYIAQTYGIEVPCGVGITPSEAVANLWLALNKKGGHIGLLARLEPSLGRVA